jgi:hypothetical protein
MEGPTETSCGSTNASSASNEESYLTKGLKNIVGFFTGSEQEQDKMREAAEAPKEPEVCQFFLEGRCRFGDACRNKHPEEKAPNVNNNSDQVQKAEEERPKSEHQ